MSPCPIPTTISITPRAPPVVDIVIIGVLTRCGLLHAECDLKVVQMNLKGSLIQELMLYESKMGHDVTEATKKICCAKDEGAADDNIVTR